MKCRTHRLVLLNVLIAMTTGQLLQDKPTKHIDHLTLFPEKKTWCEVKEIQQEVTLPGCHSKYIPNTVCFGQCFSYSIPQSMPDEADPHLQHCECCKPLRMSEVKVTLQCPKNDVKVKDKFVEVVEECACQKCFESTADDRDVTFDESSYYYSY